MFILLSVCLMGSPQTCREEPIRWSLDQRSSLQCMLGAQTMIAKWHEDNQKWDIKSWRCVPKDRLLTAI